MKTFGPYSPIYQTGNHYFVSGQVGVDPKSKKVSAAIGAQTKQTMKNIQAVLETRGLSFSDLAKTTIFLRDINDFKKVNEIYESYFNPSAPKPARSCVEISKLPKVAAVELLIEIEAVAYKE